MFPSEYEEDKDRSEKNDQVRVRAALETETRCGVNKKTLSGQNATTIVSVRRKATIKEKQPSN